MNSNKCNSEWKRVIQNVNEDYEYVSSPRDMEIRETLHGSYTVPMPAFLSVASRDLNYAFMMKEAGWIISGSNKLSDLTSVMKSYKNYSDDSIFLQGAYGVKIVDQLTYITKTLGDDIDSRQAVLNIWRERPGSTKDVPCTTNMQFLVREDKLHMIATMRSHDAVLGAPYDMFSFSMVALAVKLLLKETRGINVELGDLTVNAGSLHVYERHYNKISQWLEDTEVNEDIDGAVQAIVNTSKTYEELILGLNAATNLWKEKHGKN